MCSWRRRARASPSRSARYFFVFVLCTLYGTVHTALVTLPLYRKVGYVLVWRVCPGRVHNVTVFKDKIY